MKAGKAMAFGTFDLIHLGHVFYLRKAKSFARKLFVVVARDENVVKLKGKKPLNNERDRVEVIQALEMVDKAVLGSKNDFLEPIKKFKPDVIVLGYDQKPGKKELKKMLETAGLKARIERVKALKRKSLKTSAIKARIAFATKKN